MAPVTRVFSQMSSHRLFHSCPFRKPGAVTLFWGEIQSSSSGSSDSSTLLRDGCVSKCGLVTVNLRTLAGDSGMFCVIITTTQRHSGIWGGIWMSPASSFGGDGAEPRGEAGRWRIRGPMWGPPCAPFCYLGKFESGFLFLATKTFLAGTPVTPVLP